MMGNVASRAFCIFFHAARLLVLFSTLGMANMSALCGIEGLHLAFCCATVSIYYIYLYKQPLNLGP